MLFSTKIAIQILRTAIARFVRVCEALDRQGFNFNKFVYSKGIEQGGKKKQVGKTLEDIKKEYPDIDIDRILEETGVDLNYSIGGARASLLNTIRGNGSYLITEEEKLYETDFRTIRHLCKFRKNGAAVSVNRNTHSV